ncbi:MAG TPA: hypothetical protein VFM81_02325 [Actinomycetota bacterium]|nr:hypothetical protein [Actinomycetota bacterium]
MDEGAASPERLGKVVPLRVAAQPPPPYQELVEQSFRIAIGATALTSEVLAEAVARTLGREPFVEGETPGDETSRPATGVPLVAGAAIGVALEGARWGARAATTMVRSAELFFSLLTSPGFVRQPMRRAEERLGALDARWREQRPLDEEAAASFLRLMVPQVVDAVLDQIDLNELVAERIELDRVIDRLDLDRAIARLNIDAIVSRIDLDRIVERIDVRAIVERVPVEEVVSRLDLDAIVASVDLDQVVRRVDVQAVADRIDLQALVRRLDLTAIAGEVIEELELVKLIQDAVGSMTNETVGGIRVQSMNADRAISRLRERLLGRGDGDGATAAPPNAPSEPATGGGPADPEPRARP